MQKNDFDAFVDWSRKHLPEGQGLSALEQIGRFERMATEQKLWLYGHGLRTLPEAVGSLTQLRAIDVRANPLQALPERLGELQALEMLEVYQAEFGQLPPSFTRLSALSYCVMRARLTELPADFGAMRALTYLDLSDNRLTSLPESMRQLTALKTLKLGSNRFRELPAWLGELTELEHLDLRGNPLTSLPDSLGHCPKLRFLDAGQAKVPELARWRAMRKGPLGEIQVQFSKMLAFYGHELPPDDALHRRPGRVGGDPDEDFADYGRGDVVYYLFGRDARGEYLDFYTRNRLAGDTHARIYEDGSVEPLDVEPTGRASSKDPAEDARLEAQYQVEASRIYAELRAKGFA